MAAPGHDQRARAWRIVIADCAAAGVATDTMRGRARGRAIVDLRNRIALRIWTECEDYRLVDVARAIGRADHSAAINAILAGAAAAGRRVSRVSDLRGGGGDDLDWTKLAYAMAGWRSLRDLTHGQAAERAGIGRGEWRKAEHGRSVAPATMLRIARIVEIDVFSLLPTPLSSSPSGSSLASDGCGERPPGAGTSKCSTRVSCETGAIHAA